MDEFRSKAGVRFGMVFAVGLAAALPLAASAGPPPADKCEAAKNKIAGALYACLEKAQSTAILKGLSPDFSKCTTKFLDKWGGAETKGEGSCPDIVDPPQDMADYITGQATEAAAVIAGGAIPTCTADLEACQVALGECAPACDLPLSCPAADASHQTICGQVFDLEDGSKFQAPGATGAQCTTTTASGPCSLGMAAFDAIQFAMDPTSATPLSSSVYIDDCGRYRVSNITLPSNSSIALRIDDAGIPEQGPTGSTNTVAISTPKQGGTATEDLDGWVASKTTTDLWEGSGGPPVSGGLFVPIFFEQTNPTSRDLQDGVTITKNGGPILPQDNYFVATETARHTIDAAATVTGNNGTALVTGASVADGLAYGGSGGGLSASCVWPSYIGASLANILYVQEFRPKDAIAQTCDR